jgi:3-oxoacyl-[acyl-carrier protein] reductase
LVAGGYELVMDLGLKGRHALVAAGTQGIGFAAVESLLREGARVSYMSRRPESVAEAGARLARGFPDAGERAFGSVADVSDAAKVEAWIAEARRRFGPVEILVTNTGGPPAATAMAATEEQWKSGFESTLLNVVRMTAAVVPEMKAARWGRIVHVTSLVARDPSDLIAISSTLRTGLRALTQLQARELGPSGVLVNSVLPGHTLTARQTHLAEIEAAKAGASVEEILRKRAEHVPLRRIADPREIGDVIAFLCSERASYLSGESVLVDGAVSRGV